MSIYMRRGTPVITTSDYVQYQTLKDSSSIEPWIDNGTIFSNREDLKLLFIIYVSIKIKTNMITVKIMVRKPIVQYMLIIWKS